MTQLNQLKQYTTIVVDTSDIDAIAQYAPQDATTNPSLLLKAAKDANYQHLVTEAIVWAKSQKVDKKGQLLYALNKLAVNFGVEILKLIPGRVSTEVDARLSFDTQTTIDLARQVIDLYRQQGIDRDRVLIKIAATWEGVQAAKVLEIEGIHCNLTLIFDFMQALACAEAGATLISPFVGRIYDWYKHYEQSDFKPEQDPGVLSVRKIYEYFRYFDYDTIVMGASFRHVGQIEALAGCDYLTIAPALLEELQSKPANLQATMSVTQAKATSLQKVEVEESSFRWYLNENAMASEKLSEGIRLFARDIVRLEEQLASQLAQ